MIKKIFYIIVFLLVGLLLAYLFRYKTGPCLCDTIPDNAEAAVLINVRALEQHFLHDFLANPSSYLSSTETKTDSTKAVTENKVSLLDALTIPEALVCYKQQDQWLSSEIPIKDQAKTEQLLRAYGYKSIASSTGKTYKKNKLYAKLFKDKLRLAFGTVTDPNTLFSQKTTTYSQASDKIFSTLKNMDCDLCYADDKGQVLDLDFESGAIQLAGQYKLAALNNSSENPTKGLGQLATQVNVEEYLELISPEQKAQFTNFTKLNIDTLKQFWDGTLLASLQQPLVVIDTITSYDYDDDFNKIEVQKINKTKVPNYTIQLGLDAAGVDYMKRQKAIVTENGHTVLAIMPLAKTYCRTEDNKLYLYTFDANLATETSESKMKIIYDNAEYASLLDDSNMLAQKPYKNLSNINLEIDKANNITGTIKVQGKRNAFVSLLSPEF